MKNPSPFLAMAFLAVSSLSFGQLKFGIQGGVGTSRLAFDFADPSEEMNTKPKFSFNFGVVGEYSISQKISLMSGLQFQVKGTSEDIEALSDGDFKFEGYKRISLHYLEVPINLALKVKSFRLYAGPYLALGVGGKVKRDITVSYLSFQASDKEELEIKFKNKITEKQAGNSSDAGLWYSKPVDYGVNLGMGFQFSKIALYINYSIGFANLAVEPDVPTYEYSALDYAYSNRAFTFNLTYRLFAQDDIVKGANKAKELLLEK